MTDALSTHKPKSGLYLKFNDGDEVKLRVLTLDPLVSEKAFTDKKTGETNISTKYGFIVWNWNEDRAQAMEVGPGLLNRLVRIHQDEDMPPINHADIKISATGEMLARRYEVQVLPTSKQMTPEAVAQAAALKLEDLISDSKGRLSEFSDNPEDLPSKDVNDDLTGLEKARATARKIDGKQARAVTANEGEDTVIEDIGDEPINLDQIPF